jgi:hypothetical protein
MSTNTDQPIQEAPQTAILFKDGAVLLTYPRQADRQNPIIAVLIPEAGGYRIDVRHENDVVLTGPYTDSIAAQLEKIAATGGTITIHEHSDDSPRLAENVPLCLIGELLIAADAQKQTYDA